jgi:predicted HD phosphohydrolase
MQPLDRSGPHADFQDIRDSTADDWRIIVREFIPFAAGLAGRVLSHLKLLEGDYGGYPVDRLTHCRQTATRALRDGRDDEYVVCALLHDIGDTLGTFNHPDIAASILKPFVSDENHAIVLHHGAFQGYYYYHHIGRDKHVREDFIGQPFFDATRDFCEYYDAPSFDASYDALPLEAFEAMVKRVLYCPRSMRPVPKPTAQATHEEH